MEINLAFLPCSGQQQGEATAAKNSGSAQSEIEFF